MTTGDSINPKTRPKRREQISYFSRSGGARGLWGHIDTHLQNKGRTVTTNPYHDNDLGFTTTFYEIMEASDELNELWRHGPLYNDPLERKFRKCSYTVSCVLPNISLLIMLRLYPDIRTDFGLYTRGA